VLINFVFLKILVLSQRLGLGKGGLRMAPEENLLQVLQVSHLYAVLELSINHRSNDAKITRCIFEFHNS
jgi:hypothetical protein